MWSRREILRLGAATLGAQLVSPPARGQGMVERSIPRTDERLPAVGLGTWQVFDVASDARELGQARETLRVFTDGGGRVIDSSPMYGSSEAVTGQLAAELGVAARLFVATKVWTSGKQAGIRQMEDSLRKLRVERLDLMQVHNLVDVQTHLATLAEWRAAGRVRYVGITHYHAGGHAELERLLRRGDVDFVQVNYSLAEPQAEFAEGAMFGRVKGKAVPEWAQAAGCASWAQYFLKWILAHPAVTCVIPGTRNPRHAADNLGAMAGAPPDAAMRRRMSEHFNSL